MMPLSEKQKRRKKVSISIFYYSVAILQEQNL